MCESLSSSTASVTVEIRVRRHLQTIELKKMALNLPNRRTARVLL